MLRAGSRQPGVAQRAGGAGLSGRDLMEKPLEKLSWGMHWLNGATHSFRARDYPEIAAVTAEWLPGL